MTSSVCETEVDTVFSDGELLPFHSPVQSAGETWAYGLFVAKLCRNLDLPLGDVLSKILVCVHVCACVHACVCVTLPFNASLVCKRESFDIYIYIQH